MTNRWCRRRDLNPHGFPHTPLKRACLPFHHFGTIRKIQRNRERSIPSGAAGSGVHFSRGSHRLPNGIPSGSGRTVSPPGRTAGQRLEEVTDIKGTDSQNEDLEQKHHGHVPEKKQDNIQERDRQTDHLDESCQQIHISIRSGCRHPACRPGAG